MDRSVRQRVQRVLLDSVLNTQCSLDELDTVWSDVPLAQLNPLNWASLLTSGIGEDYLYLNESMAEGKSLLDFTTLYDNDYNDHLFQEAAMHRDFPEYEGADDYAWHHPSWARFSDRWPILLCDLHSQDL
ncbi:MAG: hypothetical protein K0A95_00675 [Chromatiales bacterium]|nr:hypothetical protein [Gammaproteobacteria bacterium]MBW6475580.1 hypothetical protein [Chromatiales bacterium]